MNCGSRSGVEYSSGAVHHRHECPKCGAVWEHADICRSLPDPEWERVHTCPTCGLFSDGTKYIYDGPCKPTAEHSPPADCSQKKGKVKGDWIATDTVITGDSLKAFADSFEAYLIQVHGLNAPESKRGQS